MSRVRQKGTSCELKTREVVEALGVRYETNVNGLPGRPDLVDPDRRWALFVHGCFWHAHDNCSKWRVPESNRQFWLKKFESNVTRDKQKVEELRKMGISVIVVWQCELEKDNRVREKLKSFFEGTRKAGETK